MAASPPDPRSRAFQGNHGGSVANRARFLLEVDEFSVGRAGWPGTVVRPLREHIPLTLSLVRSRFDTPSRQAQAFVGLLRAQAGGM